MSHLTSVKTKINDLNAVRLALTELGLALEGQGLVRGGGREQMTEAVIKLKGGHDLGFVRNSEGVYDVVGDWYYAQRELGGQEQFMTKLNQLYGVHKATQEAQLNGYLVERETDQNGVIRLTLSQPY